jgi:anti-sigma B factor antagonist
MLRVRAEQSGEARILHCTGRLVRGDETNALREAVTSRVKQGRVILDLAGVSTIDAAGLGALVSMYRWSCDRRIELQLINLNERVHNLLRITGLDKVLTICWPAWTDWHSVPTRAMCRPTFAAGHSL